MGLLVLSSIGTTYNENVGMVASASAVPAASVTMEGSVPLTGGSALSAPAGALAITNAVSLLAQALLDLAQSRGFIDTVSLDGAAGINATVLQQLAAALALQADAAIQQAATAQFTGTVDATAAASIVHDAAAILGAALGLSATAQLEQLASILNGSAPQFIHLVAIALRRASLASAALERPRITDVDMES